MTDFAVFLGEKVERYIELRRALGYAFDKQAGTLRAIVRHIERAELDAPATRTSCRSAAESPEIWRMHGAPGSPCGGHRRPDTRRIDAARHDERRGC